MEGFSIYSFQRRENGDIYKCIYDHFGCPSTMSVLWNEDLTSGSLREGKNLFRHHNHAPNLVSTTLQCLCLRFYRECKHIARFLDNCPGAVNIADECNGQTPLHVACANGNLDYVVVLVDCGAKLWPMNDASQHPLELASDNGHTSVVSFIMAAWDEEVSGLIVKAMYTLIACVGRCYTGVRSIERTAKEDMWILVGDKGRHCVGRDENV
jgi:hypothetical protein